MSGHSAWTKRPFQGFMPGGIGLSERWGSFINGLDHERRLLFLAVIAFNLYRNQVNFPLEEFSVRSAYDQLTFLVKGQETITPEDNRALQIIECLNERSLKWLAWMLADTLRFSESAVTIDALNALFNFRLMMIEKKLESLSEQLNREQWTED